jgi:hypothetical protein
MGEEEWEQSEDENCEAGRDEVDEGDGEKQGDDGDGEEEGCVRRLVGQMREEWEDGVVYVGTTNVFRFRSYTKEMAVTYTKPMRFWIPCRLACQTAVPSDA